MTMKTAMTLNEDDDAGVNACGDSVCGGDYDQHTKQNDDCDYVGC